MQIDLFTFVAQIVNFLILVALLRIFLFRPIVAIVAERERRIAKSVADSSSNRSAAAEELAQARGMREAIEKDRTTLLAQAQLDANARRKELYEQAHSEIAGLRERWMAQVDQEHDAIVSMLRDRCGRIICTIIRRMFVDLAETGLEQQIVRSFLARMGKEPPALTDGSAGLATSRCTVATAFDMPPSEQQELTAKIRALVGPSVDVSFVKREANICGLELTVGERTVAWHVSDYLDQLQEAMRELATYSPASRHITF